MKDALGHGSNGRSFGRRTPQPSVSNVEAVKALIDGLRPPAPIHDAMSGQGLVRSIRGGPRMSRDLRDDPISMRGLRNNKQHR